MSKTSAKFVSPDISCNHCAMAIKNGLGPVDGVDAVAVDVDTKTVTVDFESDRVSETDIRSKLSELGYPAE